MRQSIKFIFSIFVSLRVFFLSRSLSSLALLWVFINECIYLRLVVLCLILWCCVLLLHLNNHWYIFRWNCSLFDRSLFTFHIFHGIMKLNTIGNWILLKSIEWKWSVRSKDVYTHVGLMPLFGCFFLFDFIFVCHSHIFLAYSQCKNQQK